MKFEKKMLQLSLPLETPFPSLRGVEWVHGLFSFPLVLGKM